LTAVERDIIAVEMYDRLFQLLSYLTKIPDRESVGSLYENRWNIFFNIGHLSRIVSQTICTLVRQSV